ncbi:hypothetical protein DITRI_Ditri01bG0137400 [Diplodiscus trichospermus]
MAPGGVHKLKMKQSKSQQSVLNNASKHVSMDMVTIKGVKAHVHQANIASEADKSNSLSKTQTGTLEGTERAMAN